MNYERCLSGNGANKQKGKQKPEIGAHNFSIKHATGQTKNWNLGVIACCSYCSIIYSRFSTLHLFISSSLLSYFQAFFPICVLRRLSNPLSVIATAAILNNITSVNFVYFSHLFRDGEHCQNSQLFECCENL